MSGIGFFYHRGHRERYTENTEGEKRFFDFLVCFLSLGLCFLQSTSPFDKLAALYRLAADVSDKILKIFSVTAVSSTL
jgi:hypothetical protein